MDVYSDFHQYPCGTRITQHSSHTKACIVIR